MLKEAALSLVFSSGEFLDLVFAAYNNGNNFGRYTDILTASTDFSKAVNSKVKTKPKGTQLIMDENRNNEKDC